jgi:hypothetical protein
MPTPVQPVQHERRCRRRHVCPSVAYLPSSEAGADLPRVGKDCVAIGCDLRLGMQALTVSNNFPKIFSYGDAYLGLTGLATDVTTMCVYDPGEL